MKLSGRTVNLVQLQSEMKAAGIVVTALGMTDSDLHTYGADGVSCELPEGAAAVVEAHVPTPEPVLAPDGDQVELDAAITAATTVAMLKAALLGSRGGRVQARPGA